MKVKVNRTWIEIFEGADVRQAVLRYFIRRQISTAMLSRCKAYDEHGHLIDMNAPLSDGQTIKLR